MASTLMRNGLLWFKCTDLRVRDHLPLLRAHEECNKVNHVFVFDPCHYGPNGLGEPKVSLKRLMYQYECVQNIRQQIICEGGTFHALVGDTTSLLDTLVRHWSIDSFYTHDEKMLDEQRLLFNVQEMLFASRGDRISVHATYDVGGLIPLARLPFSLSQLDSFSSFRKAVQSDNLLDHSDLVPRDKPDHWREGYDNLPSTISDADLSSYLLHMPSNITEGQHHQQVLELWNYMCEYHGQTTWKCLDSTVFSSDSRSGLRGLHAGETEALEHLRSYSCGPLIHYKQQRNGMVGVEYSSKLSPYLAHGCLTARTVYHVIKQAQLLSQVPLGSTTSQECSMSSSSSLEAQLQESVDLLVAHLLWRDYMHFYAMNKGRNLFHRYGRRLHREEDRSSLKQWSRDINLFQKWQLGQTGYPFIDASMRELLHTGYMSNRGRQNVVSFLVNELIMDWTWGAQHFESHLLDYDVAANYGNWQYLVGIGSDPRTKPSTPTSALQGRYFNLVKQALLYDPQAQFVRMWCPELNPLLEVEVREEGCDNGDVLNREAQHPESITSGGPTLMDHEDTEPMASATPNVDIFFSHVLLTTAIKQYVRRSGHENSFPYPVEPIVPLLHTGSHSGISSGTEGSSLLQAVKGDIQRSKRLQSKKRRQHGNIPLLDEDKASTS